MHLNESEFIDLLDGTLAPERTSHVDGCPACRSQAETVRAALNATLEDVAHDPSPLFWNTFPDRVMNALDRPQPRRSWAPRFAFVAVAAVAMLVLAVALFQSSIRHDVSNVATSQTAAPAPAPAPSPATAGDDDIDQDAAWAVVRAAADELQYDDVLGQGIAATPGSSEAVAMELSETERAELVRLIQTEMKRSGA